MRVLMLGDIFGQTGRDLVCRHLPKLRESWRIDWTVANGENGSGGAGLAPRHARGLLNAGVDVLTMGNHLFSRKDWHELVKNHQVTRPQNLGGVDLPGSGLLFQPNAEKARLAVVNLAGRVFMDRGECPFSWADRLLERIPAGLPVLVDFHAEATSEKLAMGWYLAGRVALMAGTHTHVQTADAVILPGGTGYISDLGLTGPEQGILGVDRATVLERFKHGYSGQFFPAVGVSRLEGILAEINGTTTTALFSFRIGEDRMVTWTGSGTPREDWLYPDAESAALYS